MSIDAVSETIQGFTLSFEALTRMDERGVSAEQLDRLLEFPAIKKLSPKGGGLYEYRNAECGAIVNEEERRVVTVLTNGVNKAEDAALREQARQEYIKDALPVPERATGSLKGAPKSFSETPVEVYLIFWARKYKAMGLI